MDRDRCVCCLRNDMPVSGNENCNGCGPMCAPCDLYQMSDASAPDTVEHMKRHYLITSPWEGGSGLLG